MAIPPPASFGPSLSATGVAQLAGAASSGGMLFVSLQEQVSGGSAQAAVATLRARIATLRRALVAAGIPAAAIEEDDFNVGPSYGGPVAMGGVPIPMPTPTPRALPPPGSTEPATPATPDALPLERSAGGTGVAPAIVPPFPVPSPGFMANASLRVTTTSEGQQATALQTALDNGATSVHSAGKDELGAPPDAAAISAAAGQATAQARAMAQASTAAAGVTLGAVQSVHVQPLMPSYGPSPKPMWQVQVQVQVVYSVR
ncbi:MAG: DUF541 domain-containing protein [Dehalococcoidia bacterium]|nr:DUF541 domain-containing protein [Dehalococcoidia bacterium]